MADYANQATAPAEHNESKALISRLQVIRGLLGDARGSALSAADKIVGQEPSKLQPSPGNSIAEVPTPDSFLPKLSSLIGEIERVASDIDSQLNRLHRSF